MPIAVKPNSISPYLNVPDAAAALAFYEKAFDAEVHFRMPLEGDPKERLLHAEFSIGGNKFMLSDPFPEWGGGTEAAHPEKYGGTTVSLNLTVETPEAIDEIVNKAAAAGGKIVMPPEDQCVVSPLLLTRPRFWGDRYASYQDPFGHRWAFASEISAERKAVAEKKWEEMKKQMTGGKRDSADDAAAAEAEAKKAKQ